MGKLILLKARGINQVDFNQQSSEQLIHNPDWFTSSSIINIMHQETPGNSSNFGKNLNPEQFDQLVEAILAGKYSWACVLMLRFAGYNPLHYIPYRTYNRLIKENSQVGRANSPRPDNMKIAHLPTEKRAEKSLPSSCLGKLKELPYLEVVGKQKKEIRGGSRQNNLQQFLTSQGEEPQPFQAKTETTQDLSLFCDFN